MKIDLLSAGSNKVVRNKPKIGLNPLISYNGKRKIRFVPIPITRSRRVWRVKRKTGLFEVGSTWGIGIETFVMECPSPQVTQERPIVGVTPLVNVLPEKTMAPTSKLKENGVTPRSEGDVGSIEVAHKGSPEVKGLAANSESPMVTITLPLESTNGVVEEVRDLTIGLSLVPCEDKCLGPGVQLGTVSGEDVVP
ncbi:uncharacterized protein LOC121252509 [Juglans microcarpa x Juglans regia]|uniref:uncharacterized protein LOC121252509 n=1 Tax=Juglans microcarpa x Juglans regia TaxID=2249226 RepID=UPI001B7F558B|nr:uncharacterized protein LOC121252509 [Juglans microcarpa x Juglans regia]